MKKLHIQKAMGCLSKFVLSLNNEPLVITVEVKPIAALVRVPWMDWESLSQSTNPNSST